MSLLDGYAEFPIPADLGFCSLLPGKKENVAAKKGNVAAKEEQHEDHDEGLNKLLGEIGRHTRVEFEEDRYYDCDNDWELSQEDSSYIFHEGWTPDTYLSQMEGLVDGIADMSRAQQDTKRRRLKYKQPWTEAMEKATETEAQHAEDIPIYRMKTRWSEKAAEFYAVDAKTFRRLSRAMVPVILWQIMFWLRTQVAGLSEPDLSCIDYYMGLGRIRATFQRNGHEAVGFEASDSPKFQNACTLEGLVTMILFAMRLIPQGLSHWGTVCSTWVVLSRNSTMRTLTGTRGDTTSFAVRNGNRQVARMTLCLILLHCRNCCWILEQPGSSIMHLYQTMAAYFAKFGWHECRTAMGAHGGETLKPTVLRSNRAYVHKLRRQATAEDRQRFELYREKKGSNVTRLQDGADGRKRFGGNSKNLKQSQIYPQGYADSLMNLWVEEGASRGPRRPAEKEPIDLCSDSDSESDYADPPEESDLWQDLDADNLPFLMDMEPNRLPVRFA